MEKIKIWENSPWSNTKNLAEAYNGFAELIPETDWILFRDADTIFTTSDYGKQFYDVIRKYKGVRCFTSLTNRVGCKWQVAQNMCHMSDDYRYHRDIGKTLQKDNYGKALDVTDQQLMSGVLVLIKKSLWTEINGVQGEGMLGIDNQIHQKIKVIGERVYVMKGVYLYHWYSGNYGQEERNIDHLK